MTKLENIKSCYLLLGLYAKQQNYLINQMIPKFNSKTGLITSIIPKTSYTSGLIEKNCFESYAINILRKPIPEYCSSIFNNDYLQALKNK